MEKKGEEVGNEENKEKFEKLTYEELDESIEIVKITSIWVSSLSLRGRQIDSSLMAGFFLDWRLFLVLADASAINLGINVSQVWISGKSSKTFL